MLWAQMMLVASAGLWQYQPSPVLERLLFLTLRERGFSRGPLLVTDYTTAPGLLTSLMRVLHFPVLLLRTPVPRAATAAIAGEPVTGRIVILRDDVGFNLTLQSFLTTSQKWPCHWTLHTTFLVILISADLRGRDSQYSLHQILDKSHVLDASVLVLDVNPQPAFEKTSMSAILYTWLRNLSYTNCTGASGRLTLIGHWDLRSSHIIKFPTSALPRKLPRTEEGCPVTALVYPYVPLTMVQENEDGKRYFGGYEVSMLQLVAQIRGFPLRLTDDGTWLPAFGRLLANGTWSGVAGELIAGHADLALGGLPVAICNSDPLECTTSYMQQSLVWFTPHPERLSGLHSVFSEAPAEVILIMAALNAVISLVIWAASSTRGVREYSSYEDSCFATFSVSFSVPVKEPSVLSARVAFLSWILFSMAMEASLSSVITSHLSHPVFTRVITDDEELVQSGLRGASLPSIAEFYPIFQKPGSINITEVCTSFDDCARRIAYDRDVAVLAPDLGFKHIGRTKYRDELGAPLFTPLRDSVVSSPIAMVLAKGNPLAPVIGDTILRIVEAGLLRYDGQPSASGMVTDANNDKEVLVFYFVIYFTMAVSWVVVLLGEISFKKWCHRRKRIKIAPSREFYLRGKVRIRGGFNKPITFRV